MTTKNADLETSDLSQFDSVATDSDDLAAHADAAKNGSYGMQAVIDDTTAIHGQFDFANATRLRIGFWFNPNGLSLSSEDDFYIACDSTASDYIIRFYYDGSNYQLYAQIRDEVGWQSTAKVTITDDWHWVEADLAISGEGANDGFVKLWIDSDVTGPADAEVTGIDSDTRDLDNFVIGAPGSIDATISGTLYYDDIEVNDIGTPIGPPASGTAALPILSGEVIHSLVFGRATVR